MHKSLLNTLIENPKLWGKNTMSKKAKSMRIVAALDPVVFQNKAEMKWTLSQTGGTDWKANIVSRQNDSR